MTNLTASTKQNEPTHISITSDDSDSTLQINKAVQDEVAAQANKLFRKFLNYVAWVVAGAIAAIVWDLNGQIYKTVGETGVNAVSTKILEIEINRLKEEINKLERQSNIKDCLENKKVTNKAGCYHGG